VIDALLGEPIDDARARARATFDTLAGGPDRPIVLYGAGGLGRRVARGLAALGRRPVALADRGARPGAAPVEGVPVLPPAEAVERYGRDAVFVVSIWNAQTDHRYPETEATLRALGAERVAPALALFWKYPETFLPYYCLDLPERVLEAADDVRRLDAALADAASRDVLLRQLRWRLALDFDALPLPVDGPAYFQADLVPLRADELFVDCGAFDGDSLRPYLERTAGTGARALAFEPDPQSFARLSAFLGTLPSADRERVRALELAVGARRERLRFAGSGLLSAGFSEEGDVEVECVPLDEILAGEDPTYIKMDLEGAEPEALAGAALTLRRARPSMAVCVYHRPDHLWSLPLALRRALPEHSLHLRPHGYEGWDLVCYAVDPERS